MPTPPPVIAPDGSDGLSGSLIAGLGPWNGDFSLWTLSNTSTDWGGAGNCQGSNVGGMPDNGWSVDTTNGTMITVTVPHDARCGDNYYVDVEDTAGNVYEALFSVGPNLAPTIDSLYYDPSAGTEINFTNVAFTNTHRAVRSGGQDRSIGLKCTVHKCRSRQD